MPTSKSSPAAVPPAYMANIVSTPIHPAKVGVMICGHKEYWPQFPGLKEALIENARHFKRYVGNNPIELVVYDIEMIDTVEDAFAAGQYFKAQQVDLLFVYLPSYVASGRFAQGALQAGCPIVLASLQENVKFDKINTVSTMTGNGSPCQMPEAYSALMRMGKPAAGILFGQLFNDVRVQREIYEWCAVANALRAYKGAIFGHLGHSYDGMYDMNFDPTAITGAFGIHVKMLEMCEFVSYVEKAGPDEITAKVEKIQSTFDFLEASYDPTTRDFKFEDVEWAARCSVGLDTLVEKNNLSGLAYYYAGLDNIYERVASNMIIGNSLLTSRGISLAGESDMKTAIAMYTTSALGCGGSFAELISVDFEEDILLVGHDGPHDIRISDAKPHIRGLGVYHGKRGHGISVEFSIKAGPMTMLSIGSDENGKFMFIVAEGDLRKGAVPQIGNTITRSHFGGDIGVFIEDWCRAGACHHMSLSIGHNASMIEKLGKIMGIKVVRVR